MKRSHTTADKIRAGAAALERLIRQAQISSKTNVYLYDGRVSVKEVLRLAGVKSAATLHHAHHSATRKWLLAKVKELKALAGKGKGSESIEEHVEKRRDREKRMAEELAAANYKILALQRQLNVLREERRTDKTVIPFKRKR